MTLSAGIKMTAWVVIPPLLVIFALEMSGPVRHWLKHFSGVMAVMLLVPWLGCCVISFILVIQLIQLYQCSLAPGNTVDRLVLHLYPFIPCR